MKTIREAFRSMAAVVGIAALVLTACGGGGAPSSSGYGAGAPPATGADETSASQIGSTSIPEIGQVLHDGEGYTLYHLATEEASTIKCIDACVEAWPPLLAADGEPPAADGSLPGRLGTLERPDGGIQVTYKGLPLYTFAGDAEPGVAEGQGVEDVWFAVTPTGSSAEDAASSQEDEAGAGEDKSGGGYDY